MLIDITGEVWKDIKGYENKYQVSNLGNIKSLNYNNTGKEKLLKPKINRYGYNEVKLSKNNKTKIFLVATLVVHAFLGEKNEDMEVMHIGDVTDDSLQNLKYAYRSQILFATYKKGRRKGKPSDNTVSYNGKRYKKVCKIGKDYGIDTPTLLKRLDRGWNLDDALEIPKERKQKILKKKLYNYYGKLYTIKELSKISGINEGALYKRLKRGWNIYETVEIPLRKEA